MANQPTSGAQAPVTTPEPPVATKAPEIKEVFKQKVNERLIGHPNSWTGEDSVEVVRAIVGSLTNGEGRPIETTPDEDAVIQLASRPTNKLQVGVIRTIVEIHGGKMDKTVEDLISQVVSPTAFKIGLAKAGKIKDTASGGLKDLLD